MVPDDQLQIGQDKQLYNKILLLKATVADFGD